MHIQRGLPSLLFLDCRLSVRRFGFDSEHFDARLLAAGGWMENLRGVTLT